jgi:hypothetical protein
MAAFDMKMDNERERQQQLIKEKDDVAVRGKAEFDRIAAENDRHTVQINEEFERTLADIEAQRAQKHQLKEQFNEWEVKVGRELAFDVRKPEYEV